MALPASGPISGSQIGAEVGASAPYSLRSMSSTAGFSTPDAMSEFYGFATYRLTGLTREANTGPSPNACKFYYRINGGSWINYSSTSMNTSYISLPNINTIFAGSTVEIAVQTVGNVNITFGTGNGGSYTGRCGQSNPYSLGAINSNITYYINVQVVSSAFVTC